MSNWGWMRKREEKKAPVHYPDCGLDNIWLLNGYEIIETPYGQGLAVRDVDGLRAAIALRLATRAKLLSGQEVRFLRKQIDLTQSELGRLLLADAQSVARWEKSKTKKIPGSPERLLRLLYLGKACGKLDPEEVLRRLDEVDAPINNRQVFEETEKGWKQAA